MSASASAATRTVKPARGIFGVLRLQERRAALTRTAASVGFIVLWELVVRLGWISPLFLAPPSQVAVRLYHVFATGTIFPHLWASGVTAFWGFFISCIIGIPVGILMGRSSFVRNTLEPFVIAQASVPTVALLPLFIIWLGIGEGARIALVLAGSVFGIIVSTEAGVANIDERLIETALSFTATQTAILRTIVLPAAVPYIIAGMRLAVSRVLITVVVAELYAANAGIGYLIFQAGSTYDTSMIFVGVVILAAAGVTMNSLLRAIEFRLAPWARSKR
jgi:NitT/TauT family transport system permease protein